MPVPVSPVPLKPLRALVLPPCPASEPLPDTCPDPPTDPAAAPSALLFEPLPLVRERPGPAGSPAD
jgi:hypothetical protein